MNLWEKIDRMGVFRGLLRLSNVHKYKKSQLRGPVLSAVDARCYVMHCIVYAVEIFYANAHTMQPQMRAFCSVFYNL